MTGLNMRHIQHHEIDFEKWDKTILSSDLPLVFAQSFYLNATCPNWEALIMGDYESVFPLTVKSKFGFRYLPQPPFTSQLGVFGKVNLEIERAFYGYILNHFNLIDLELNATNQLTNKHIVQKNTYVINYSCDYSFNQNTKRNVAKAQALGLKVERIETNFLEVSKQYITPFLQQQVGLSLATISVLDKILISANECKLLVCFKVTDSENNIKALAHFISNGKHALYLKGTNTDRKDNSGSMHLLMAKAIEYFRDKSQWFDFGGGNQQGIANFYLGFGAQPQPYGFLQINKLPFFMKWFKN